MRQAKLCLLKASHDTNVSQSLLELWCDPHERFGQQPCFGSQAKVNTFLMKANIKVAVKSEGRVILDYSFAYMTSIKSLTTQVVLLQA